MTPDDAAEGAQAAEESAITGGRIYVREDGTGGYTATYANHEPGPVSEGYGRPGQDEAVALRLAEQAFRRDFPWVEDGAIVFEVDPGD